MNPLFGLESSKFIANLSIENLCELIEKCRCTFEYDDDDEDEDEDNYEENYQQKKHDIDRFMVETLQAKTDIIQVFTNDFVATHAVLSDRFDYLQEKSAKMIQKQWKRVFNKRRLASKIIQKTWRHVIVNPSFKICQNRLMYEFERLENTSE